jgi:bifunctional enzyme CysN/CysC
VNRPNLDFRGYAGTVSAGTVHVGDAVTVLPSQRHSTIARIVTAGGDLDAASVGQAVTLTLADEVDVSRGDVIVHRSSVMQPHKDITARLLWMGEAPLQPGQGTIVKLGTTEANATVAKLRHAVDIHSFQNQPAESLAMNGIGVVDLSFDKPIAATIYGRDRTLGSFILIDRMTNQTVALGTVEAAAARQANDNSRAQVVPRTASVAASRQRLRLRVLAARRTAEAVMLALIVWLLSGNGYLALVVAVADSVLRPVAGRVADLVAAGTATGRRPVT